MFRKKRTKPFQVTRLDELSAIAAEGKPVLVDFWQTGCNPCRIMDGIVTELADEYAGKAHVVKIDVGRVPDAVREFAIRSTPTFVVLAKSQKRPSKKARRRNNGGAPARSGEMTARWRSSGLVKKEQLARVLDSNGAALNSPAR